MVEKICNLLTSGMSLMVFLVGIVAIWNPAIFNWMGPQVPILLGVVMFGMGMSLTVDDFANVFRQPKAIFVGAFAQFFIMPMIAVALVNLFGLPPEIAIGVILLGTCPGGTASNVIAYLAKGDVALSVSMTTVSTILAPLVTPMLTWFLADAVIDISVQAMMISIVKMVLVPVLLGLAVHHFMPKFCQTVMPFMPAFSSLTVVLIVGIVVALSSAKLLEVGALLAAVVVLHNGFGLCLGYLLAKLLRLADTQARTISIEVGMQNSGMAASLALMYFDPVAAIPGAIFSVWHNITGALLANYFSRKEESVVSSVGNELA